MDAAEVFGRVREKLRARSESRDAKAIENYRVSADPLPSPAMPEFGEAPEVLRKGLASDAVRLREGFWTLYGWREVQVSLPPAWHRDYAGGVEAPALDRHVNHRSLPPGADARTIWEINRWAEMVRLAMHARMSGDVSAIETAQQWLLDWVGKNPMGRGINWTSALEGGLRLINFCWFDALVRDGADAPAAWHPHLLAAQQDLVHRILPAHVWWVHRYASFGSSANNHRLGELTGLLLAVRRWTEMEAFSDSAANLWSEISRCILAQFAADGGNREQALHYHLFAFEMAMHASRAMGSTDEAVEKRLSQAAEFFTHMEPCGGEPWDYGDSDDAQIVPLAARRAHAAAEWQAWLSGGAEGEAMAFWLGRAGTGMNTPRENSDHLPSAEGAHWWTAKESGMAMGTHGAWRARLDASPLGFGKMAAHGHGDALHVSLWHGGQAVIIDPGTGGYFGAKELRAELAAWEAHNGPQPLHGFDTPRRMGAFLLTQHHAVPEFSGSVSKDGCSVRATLKHEGHDFTRSVWFHEDSGGLQVRIHDLERGQQAFRVRWFFAPECEVHAGPDGVIEVRREHKLWSLKFEGDAVTSQIQQARASRAYGRVEECRVVEVTARGKLFTVVREKVARNA